MGMSQAEQYEKYKEKQMELAGMLKEASEIIQGLEMNNSTEVLAALSSKVHNDIFRILVVGTFKNGKSTFINSMLGEEILPAYVIPCTAVINEVKYGEKKDAILYFRNPLPEVLPEDVPQEAVQYMKKHHNKDIPPMPLPYDKLEDYVVIPMGKEQKDAMLESPYEKVDLFWPLELLENNVEIIDSPGLNEHKTRTEVTVNYLKNADAILFVLNPDHPCSKDEMDFIEGNLRKKGFEDPFFVVNRFDTKGKKDQEMLKKYFETKLKSYSSNPIHYVSALYALEGKMDGDMAKYQSSGMDKFEKELSEYLIHNKGKAKLTQPARELKRVLNEEALFQVIPKRRKMFDSSLDGIKKRYSEAQPKLADLNRKKEQLQHKLEMRIEQSKLGLRRTITNHFTDLASNARTWVDEYQPENTVSFFHREESTRKVIAEIADHVSECLEKEQDEWNELILQPLIQEKAQFVFGDTERDLDELFAEIDKVNVQLVGKEYETNDVPAWQRVVGVLGGLAIGDLGLAASGGINGISKELAKTAAFEFGAGFLLGLLGLLNPITLAAVLLGSFLFNWKKNDSNATRKLKEAVRNETVNQISKTSDQKTDELVDNIISKLSEIKDDIIHAVDVEINETNAQVQAVIAEMERGKENVRRKQEELDRDEELIKGMSKKLDDFIFDLVGA